MGRRSWSWLGIAWLLLGAACNTPATGAFPELSLGDLPIVDPGSGLPDPGTPPPDPGKVAVDPGVQPQPDPGAAVDPGPAAVDIDPGFCPNPTGDKPFGAACEGHCECATGYCYDEAYLGSFRFCTRDCQGSCEEPGSEIQQNVCLVFTTSLASAHDLTHTTICTPRCQTLEECKALSSTYDACDSVSWGGHTVTPVKTCIITSELD